MTAITRMLKFGRTYSVKLACGHQFRPRLMKPSAISFVS